MVSISASSLEKYFDMAKKLGYKNYEHCTPLSVIYFPEGGQVFLYPSCVEDSKKFIVDEKLACPEGKQSGLVNQLKYREYGKKGCCTDNCGGYILKLKPGHILFFRQDIINGGSGKNFDINLISYLH